MQTAKIPVDRRYLGGITIICWLVGGILWCSPSGDGSQGFAGTLLRVAVLLSCLWLVLPTSFDQTRLKIAWPVVLGWLLLALVIVRARMPLGYLVAAALVGAASWLVLKPWRKK